MEAADTVIDVHFFTSVSLSNSALTEECSSAAQTEIDGKVLTSQRPSLQHVVKKRREN